MQSKDLYIKELNKFDNLDNYLEMVNDSENVKSIEGLSSKILNKEDLILLCKEKSSLELPWSFELDEPYTIDKIEKTSQYLRKNFKD